MRRNWQSCVFFGPIGAANDMLFLNSTHSQAHTKKFANALHSLLEQKLVVKERPRDAYSLTARGYAASLAAASSE